MSVNYYDIYPLGTPTIPPPILGQPLLGQDAQASIISTKSLPLASYVANLDNSAWTKSFIWYDTKGRPIGTHTINHLGGFTKTAIELDFTGTPQKTFTYHSRKNATTPAITIEETLTYDLQNRLTKHEHKINSNPPEILAENEYNEIGQLKKKKVGNNIQEIEYSYNIRGWMTGINLDPNGNFQSGKLFNYKVNYNNLLEGLPLPNGDVTTPIEPKWNGNIAEVLWKNRDDTNVKRYGYVYDKVNRLTAGLYQSPLNLTSKEHSERLTYDLNGNIMTLKRSAYFMGTATDLIDNLTYNDYKGNKFTYVTDDTGDSNGYEGGENPVSYDLNGNMTDMMDKGISEITYNHLNLPNKIIINEEGTTDIIIQTLYSADGTKLKKTNTTTISGIMGTTTNINTTDYLEGFQYLASERSSMQITPGGINGLLETEVAMEREAFMNETLTPQAVAPPGGGGTDNTVLQFVPTAEGFYDFIENKYVYKYKDHLGNTRVTYAKNTVTSLIDILDKNDYYPFGMNHLDSNAGSFVGQSSYKNYKFGSKELQETGFYDFGARFYMSDIAVFGTHDPLSESTLQPYAFAYNNPIFYNDPSGMEGEAAASDDSSGGGEASNGGGGIGAGFGSGGTCPPDCGGGNKGNGITPASMGNIPGGYDGAPREIAGAGVDDVAADHDIQGIILEGASYSPSLPVSGSVTVGGGGNGMKKGPDNNPKSFVQSDIWNSHIARYFIKDTYTIGLNSDLSIILGGGSSVNITLLTRGQNPGIYFTPTVSGSIGSGFNASATISFSNGLYTGDPRTITSSMLPGSQYGVSFGAGLLGKISLNAGYAPTGNGKGFINGGFQIGAGIQGSPWTGVDARATYQYTPIAIPIIK